MSNNNYTTDEANSTLISNSKSDTAATAVADITNNTSTSHLVTPFYNHQEGSSLANTNNNSNEMSNIEEPVSEEQEYHDVHSDGENNDDDENEEEGNHWCYVCQHLTKPLMDTGIPTCPICDSDFVEEIGEGDDPRNYGPAAEEDWNNPANITTVPADFAQVLQSFLQQMVGNNATISVQTRPPDREAPNGIIIATATTEESGASNIASNNNMENANETSTTAAVDTLASQQSSQQRPEHAENQQNGISGGQPEPIHLALVLRALLEGRTNTIANQLPQILNMVGNPGDYVFDRRGLDDIITQLMEQNIAGHRTPAANEDTIKSLPRTTLNQEQVDGQVDCAICQDEFKVADTVMLLPCKHFFHPVCIESWLKVNGTCPTCRYDLVAKNSNSRNDSAPISSSSSSSPAPIAPDLD